MQNQLIIKINKYLNNQPIEKAWLFGSFAREEEDPQSDIDVMVRFSKPNNITLLKYIHIMNQLKDITGRNIDLVEEGQLKDYAFNTFEKDKILIYERKTKGQRKTETYY